MNPQTSWLQPEQEGPAKTFWMNLWESHVARENIKMKEHESSNNTEIVENGFDKRSLSNNTNNNNNRASTYAMNRNHEALIGKYGGCPWRTTEIYDRLTINGLHQEIEEFHKYMSPTREEHQIRIKIVGRVKYIIHKLWPTAKVEVFGSFKTSLYLPTSDIDIVVLGDWKKLPLMELQEALLENNICDQSQIKVLDKASVPIVKFTERMSDIKVDISFNMNNGVKSVELITHFCQIFPALRKLVLVLKQFLLQRDLNEVFHGGISSYSLILMCVSFLQMHPFNDPTRDDCNLGILLIEFLELYGRRFNYLNTAISVKNGGMLLPKDDLQKDMIDGHRPSILSIEDPLTPGNDIGKGSYGALQVKDTFDYAYTVLTSSVAHEVDANKVSVLGRIIRVTDKIIDYRKWLQGRYPVLVNNKDNNQYIEDTSNGNTTLSADSDSENSSQERLSDNVVTQKQQLRRIPTTYRCTPSYNASYIRGNPHHPHHQNNMKHVNGINMPIPVINGQFNNNYTLHNGYHNNHHKHHHHHHHNGNMHNDFLNNYKYHQGHHYDRLPVEIVNNKRPRTQYVRHRNNNNNIEINNLR